MQQSTKNRANDNSRKRRSETAVVSCNDNKSGTNVVDIASGQNSSRNGALLPGDVAVRIKIRLKRFHGVAAWSWNANDDVCGICQSAFEGTAPGVKFPGEDCPVVWGKCGHAFHLQCVSKWLSQPSSKNSCPICRQEWEFGQNPINTDNVSS